MRGRLLRVGLAAVGAVVLPVPALADSGVSADGSRHETPEVGGIPFASGEVSCSRIPVAAAEEPAPVGSGACPGVRPGGRVLTTIADCSLNFLFQAPDGTRYIGTAGHCVDPGGASNEESDPDGRGRIERVWPLGDGPTAEDSTGQRFGEFAYAVVNPSKDFALIRLDPGVESSPEMCYFGAPQGTFTTDTNDAVVLRYYGNAEGVGDVAPARSAVALGTPNPDHVFANGLALPGDSGAGVMTADGLAIGVLVTSGFHGIGFEPRDPDETPLPSPRTPQINENGVDVGTIGITRLGPQLARASARLGVPLTLVTEG
ncbi:MAG: hypothetical protein ACRDYV_12900 [Acidimicrobiia bacterium]